MFRCLTLTIAIAVCHIQTVYGAVFFNEIEFEITEYGRYRYCLYEGKMYGPGSRFTDLDTCTRCKCTRSGLECSTMAFGVFVEDENTARCENVVHGCRNRWVRKRNPRRRCPKRLIPVFSMIGK